MSTGALTIVFAILALLLIGLAVAVYLLYRQVQQLRFDSESATAVAEALRDGRDEEAIRELLDYLEAVHSRLDKLGEHARSLDDRVARISSDARKHIQRMGVVRFDASESVSGTLSCALCVLDADGNGFLVTTLYDLERSRTFVRAVSEGKTEREMLDPEQQALQQALRGIEVAARDA